MRTLLKRWFNAFVQNLWIREIEKATDELRKAKREVRVKTKTLQVLLQAYEKEYPSTREV